MINTHIAASRPIVTFFVPVDIWGQMVAYARTAKPFEVQGWGHIKYVSPTELWLEEVFILQQTVGAAEATADIAALSQYLEDMVRQNKAQPVQFQWHSHVNMSAKFSSIDTGTMDTAYQNGWILSLVLNVREEFELRLDQYTPFRVANIPVRLQLVSRVGDDVMANIRQEVAAKLGSEGRSFFGLGPKRSQPYAVNVEADPRLGNLPGAAVTVTPQPRGQES
jgi:hypothetical protein